MIAKPALQNHIVICGWNSRAPEILRALLALTRRPVVIIHRDVGRILSAVSSKDGVYFMAGDSANPAVLRSAEVAHAHSVLVLADDSLGAGADARSIQIALAVEKIRSTVYSVVEVTDLRNKTHFSWTKVDDMVASQKIAVCLVAQGVRHLVTGHEGVKDDFAARVRQEREFMRIYRQLLDPFQPRSQLVRLELSWSKVKRLRFSELIAKGLPLRVLPVGLVGYRRHETREIQDSGRISVSWKTHTISSPVKTATLTEIWEVWPGEEFPLGLLACVPPDADQSELAAQLQQGL